MYSYYTTFLGKCQEKCVFRILPNESSFHPTMGVWVIIAPFEQKPFAHVLERIHPGKAQPPGLRLVSRRKSLIRTSQ